MWCWRFSRFLVLVKRMSFGYVRGACGHSGILVMSFFEGIFNRFVFFCFWFFWWSGNWFRFASPASASWGSNVCQNWDFWRFSKFRTFVKYLSFGSVGRTMDTRIFCKFQLFTFLNKAPSLFWWKFGVGGMWGRHWTLGDSGQFSLFYFGSMSISQFGTFVQKWFGDILGRQRPLGDSGHFNNSFYRFPFLVCWQFGVGVQWEGTGHSGILEM